MVRDDLPSDLWSEILCYLPVKTLLRFRSVSKTWHALIADPTFVRLHLHRFDKNRHESQLFAIEAQYPSGPSPPRIIPCWFVICNKTLKTTDKLPVKDVIGRRHRQVQDWYPMGSMDGVFMLKNNGFDRELVGLSGENPEPEFMLWNPSIRKVRVVPPLPEINRSETVRNIDLGIGVRNIDLSIGFDPSINDYKYVRLVVVKDGSFHSAVVYTFGTDSWKTIPFQGHDKSLNLCWPFTTLYPSVCLRGALYFLVEEMCENLRLSYKVVWFDFSSEGLASVGCPVAGESEGASITLADGGSCVTVISIYRENHHGSVWVLDTESMNWTKRYSFALSMDRGQIRAMWSRFLYLRKDGEMLLQWYNLRKENMVVCHNLETHSGKVVERKNYLFHWDDVSTYVESLMLLN